MYIKKVFVLVMMSMVSLAGLAGQSDGFRMRIDEIQELKGFVLKGLAVSGTITSGCILNEDNYVIVRDDKKLFEAAVSILEVKKDQDDVPADQGGTAGDFVVLYLPDKSLEDVKVGDYAIGDRSCSY
jgi:hypothetical protein